MEKLSAKEKKMQRLCNKGIYFGLELIRGVEFRYPLKDIAKKDGGTEFLQKTYDRLKLELGNKSILINKNLEELGVKL